MAAYKRFPSTRDELLAAAKKARRLREFRLGTEIAVDDRMQAGYSYVIACKPGTELGFEPAYTPAEMLAAGVFEGRYLTDCAGELPREWYEGAIAKLSPAGPDASLNMFGVKSRQSLGEWRRKGWIIGDDPRGWFQWYYRYWLGRRDPEVDAAQIARWRSFRRHAGQIKAAHTKLVAGARNKAGRAALAAFEANPAAFRAKQRQALLQWAHNPFPEQE